MGRLIFGPLANMLVILLSGIGGADAPQEEPLSDEQFVIRAMECTHAEVQRAELAQKRAEAVEVRKFAQSMSDEHDQCRKELLKQAGPLKVGVVSGLSKEHKESMDRLSKLEGNRFDREYLQTVIDNHQKAIKLFEAEAKSGSIDALRVHAKKMIPVLQKHRQEAQNLKAKVEKS